jgi:hypothetical protein
MTFSDFELYYLKNGRLPNKPAPSKPYNEKQLKSAYEKECQRELKAKEKAQKDAEKVKTFKTAGPRVCALLSRLAVAKIAILKENAGGLIYTVDPAHIFGRGAFPHMADDEDNIVWLNRYSHGNLDTCRDPISGTQITDEKRKEWWVWLVGQERYKRLLLKSKKQWEES